MARRARETQSVQLFPFLAVLVCVMGSLIFLLLVSAKKLRAAAVAKAVAAAQVVEDEPLAPDFGDEAPPVVWVEPEEPVVAAAPPGGEPPQSAAPRIDRAAIEAERAALHATWAARVAELASTVDARQQGLNRERLLALAAQRQIDELQQQLLQQELELSRLMGQVSADADRVPASAAERAKLEAEIAKLRARLKELQSRQQESASRFSIVAFEGKSGTTRKPILIECTATGLRFLPEDVVLTPADIEGATPRANPLLAGTMALMAYWSQAPAAQREPPYVLLVVRPDGTFAYYIAMKLLSSLKQPFGYELVTDDVELALPPVDPQARELLTEAIRRSQEQRVQMQQAGRGGFGGPGPGGTSGGRFTDGSAGGGLGNSVSPTGVGSGQPGAKPVGTGTANGSSGRRFDLAELEGGPQVGERSWQNIERFGGQEHRQKRQGSAGATGVGTTTTGSPDPRSGEVRTSATRPSEGATPNAGQPPRRLDEASTEGEATENLTAGEPPPEGDAADTNPQGTAGPSRAGMGRPSSTAARTNASAQAAGGTSGELPDGDAEPAPFPSFGPAQVRRVRQQEAALPYEQLQRRKWGPHEPGASIGVEKPVVIRIAGDHFLVESSAPIPIPEGADRVEIFDRLLTTIDQQAQGWGQPGVGFFWVPKLKFVISPGGNSVYERIAPLVAKSGLSNRVEYTLNQAQPAMLETQP